MSDADQKAASNLRFVIAAKKKLRNKIDKVKKITKEMHV
jgi:hypothetical protein